jgi:uncharacterized protein YyaL (SSP411 family)
MRTIVATWMLASCVGSADHGPPPPHGPLGSQNYRDLADATRRFVDANLATPYGGYYDTTADHAFTSEWYDASQIYADVAMAAIDPQYLATANRTYYQFMYKLWDVDSRTGGYAPRSAPDGTSLQNVAKYVDDNSLTANAYLDAYEAASDPQQKQDYLTSARAIANWLMFSSAWDPQNGGFWWNTGPDDHFKPTQSNGLAMQLFLRLHAITNEPYYADWATSVKTWLDRSLYDSVDGLYAWRTGFANARKFTYDQAIMIEADLLLYRRFHRAEDLVAARELAARMEAILWDPVSDGFYIRSDDVDGGHSKSPVFSGWASQALLRLYSVDGDPHWRDLASRNVDALDLFLRDEATGGYRAICDPDGSNVVDLLQEVDQAWMQRVLALLAQS